MPHKDLERGSYGIQEKSLGKLFVQALALNAKTSADAQKLTNLKGKDTNYGDIVYEVMLNRSPETGTLTVYEVNKYLDLIAEHFEENERRSKCEVGCQNSFFPLFEIILKKKTFFSSNRNRHRNGSNAG